MKLNEYQNEAMKFAKYQNREYPYLALAEEAGEVMGKLAKYVRKNGIPVGQAIGRARLGHEPRESLEAELGDVLWQLQACCYEAGFTLEDIAQSNLDKLSGRESRGTIVGSGDNR